MFSKITAFLHQAAEVTSQVLAPQLSRPEEFQGHWRAITDCITTDTTDLGLTVQSVGIPRHLQTMADLLCEEEEERDPRDPGTMGPCMEFLLRHKILDTLYTTGNSNYPTGMRHEVLLFFTVLLGRLEKPIVPQVSVHQPMQKLICECGKDICGPLALDEIQFLRTLTLKLHGDPRLATFFLEDVSNKKIFMVAEAFLRLVHSQDNVVMMKSYECLLTCSSMDHLMVSKALAQSQLPMLLASQLQCHFQLIPSSLHYTSIMNCNAGWGVNYATRGTGTHVSPSAHDVWHVEAFLSWLDYCEQLVSYAAEPLADAVCEAINELLLTASLLPRLSKSSEEDILQNTAILTRSVQALSTQKLLEDFVSFALSGSPLPSDTSSCLREKLIQRIDHVNDEVCQVTLQLFDVLLHTPLSSVVHQLVLQGGEEPQLMVLQGREELMVPVEHLDTEKQQLQEDVKSYLSLVSDNLSSCDKVTGDAGLEQYLVEAHRQVATCCAITLMWGSKSGRPTAVQQCFTSHQKPEDIESPLKSNLTAEGCSEEEQCSHRTCSQAMSCSSSDGEGLFLAALLTKLERLLDQPYEVNLLLTSILSRLAAFPHPLMDQWLFSIHCHHQYNSRNVYSILKKVSSELQSHADRSPGLVVNIVEARRRLAGMETSDLLSMPHNDLLEGAIVLEEFSKELAATLFAKKTTSMLMIPAP